VSECEVVRDGDALQSGEAARRPDMFSLEGDVLLPCSLLFRSSSGLLQYPHSSANMCARHRPRSAGLGGGGFLHDWRQNKSSLSPISPFPPPCHAHHPSDLQCSARPPSRHPTPVGRASFSGRRCGARRARRNRWWSPARRSRWKQGSMRRWARRRDAGRATTKQPRRCRMCWPPMRQPSGDPGEDGGEGRGEAVRDGQARW